MPLNFFLPLLAVVMMMYGLVTVADDPQAWLESEHEPTTRSINEGDLEFLHKTPDRRALQTRNRLTITPASLHTGWVQLHQCQSNLDPVSAVEVVYRYHGMRKLQVISTRGIKHARVENNSVQMAQVEEGAEICIEADVQVLNKTGAGQYQLQSGPFHRRFLDGFYPVRLDFRIHWPADLLRLVSVQPKTQAGFTVQQQPGALAIDSLFEGRLTITSRWRALR